jgi:hypothetical protein
VAGQVVPNPSKVNFAPRLAAAYRLSDKTVIRGGYGIFNEFLGRYAYALGTGPFQIAETFTNSIQNGQPLLAFPNPFPGSGAGAVPSQSVTGYPIDTTNGKIQQFNLTVERQVKDIGFRLSYIGSRDSGLNYNLNIDKPQPSTTPYSQSRLPYPQFRRPSAKPTAGQIQFHGGRGSTPRGLGHLRCLRPTLA